MLSTFGSFVTAINKCLLYEIKCEVHLKIGIVLPQVGQRATKENVIQMANLAEKEDIDSLWVFERLLWPLNPQTPYPGSHDGSLPVEGQKVLDPLETLAFVAANTSKITLGTSIIDMLFHNPVILARRFATLDVLSEGRAICGLGIGWSKDEYQASNIPFKDRGKRADEFVQAIKKIWTEDVVEFKGQFYNIPPSKIGPKPIQKPHIPIYLGGYAPKTFARIANHADGWLASLGGPLDFLNNSIKSLRDQASKASRNLDEIKILTLTFPQITLSEGKKNNTSDNSKSGGQPQMFPLTGTIEEIGRDIQTIKEMG